MFLVSFINVRKYCYQRNGAAPNLYSFSTHKNRDMASSLIPRSLCYTSELYYESSLQISWFKTRKILLLAVCFLK